MKIIDAFWEKRNLGVDVVEVEIGKRDTGDVRETIAGIAELKAPGKLINVKLPVASLELLHALEDIGFRFLECQLKISRSLKEYEPPLEMRPLLEKTGVHVIEKNPAELEALLERITPGMFSTDRICLDPLWGDSCEELSATRYKNWIKDIFSETATTCYYFSNMSNIIGFGVAKHEAGEKHVHGLLGGVLKSEENPISSVSFIHTPLLLFRNYNAKFSTSISSNNIAVCRLYIAFGYQIEKMQYVMRWFS